MRCGAYSGGWAKKAKLSPQQVAHAKTLIEKGESPAIVAKLFGVARSTLYAAP
jgi:DNA invertase Pin-like site-specific DNA recombinase